MKKFNTIFELCYEIIYTINKNQGIYDIMELYNFLQPLLSKPSAPRFHPKKVKSLLSFEGGVVLGSGSGNDNSSITVLVWFHFVRHATPVPCYLLSLFHVPYNKQNRTQSDSQRFKNVTHSA